MSSLQKLWQAAVLEDVTSLESQPHIAFRAIWRRETRKTIAITFEDVRINLDYFLTNWAACLLLADQRA